MSASAKKQFKRGDLLIREGDKGDSAYIIETGNVEILIQRDGQALQVGTRGPGSLIGEMAMIDDKPRTATVRALDDCEVLEITREDFGRRVETADPVVKMVMRVITNRYRDMIGRTSSLVSVTPNIHAASVAAENSNDVHDIAMSTLRIQDELKTAMEQNQLTLFYQPIIDVQNMKIAGFEALMRWKHPERGMISPGVFIPVAEESGLIVELSRFALELTCATVPKLQAAANPATTGPKPLFVGVNFSVKDFAMGDLSAYIIETQKKAGVTPEQIHLEITESLLMEQPESAKNALEKCRAAGLDVSIDDFGTGYSSLSYLHYFPIDTLKIDQSFIRAMNTHTASLVLVKSIVTLAKNLQMKLIAEGVETAAEAKIVRELGVEWVQGFFFSKPLPEEDAVKFLQNWQPPQF